MWKRGYGVVVGVDEVGRGPLAGPVIACAVAAHAKFKVQSAKLKVDDSKKLSAKKREELYRILTAHPAIEWGIGRTSEKVIDKINIFQATKLAMQKAVLALEKKIGQTVEFLLIDGNFGIDMAREQKPIIKGDEKVFSCAAASIIAKVQRDKIMIKYHQKYPQYGFDKHKGYGTKQHFEALRNYGTCEIHRKSFNLIKN